MHSLSEVSPSNRSGLQAFIEDLEVIDGKPPLTEYKQFRTGDGQGAVERVAVANDGNIVGYAQAAWHGPVAGSDGQWEIEVAVAPGHRDGSAVHDLVAAVTRELRDGTVTLWAHDGYVVAAAERDGWVPERVLLKMMRALPMKCPHEIPAGLRVASFRPGVDEASWLVANNLAFRGHPENGALTTDDLERRQAQSWFDPDGFLIVWDGGSIAGSCWTKLHDGGVGEIYIIGVVPGYEGRGLGRALVCLGLDYLSRARGAAQGMLYTEASNKRAIHLYERLGFEVSERIVAYRRDR